MSTGRGLFTRERESCDLGSSRRLRRPSILSFRPSLLTGRVLLQTVNDGKGVPCMSEENKEKMRRVLEEAFGQGKLEVVDEVLHSDFVCWDPNSESGEIRGADIIK